jgi:hypothetical protein
MNKSKFNSGDKVRVIKYGHPYWSYEQEPASAKVISYDKDNHRGVYDMSPELVGKEGIISEVTKTQGVYQYSISGIPGKSAWYFEEQLELIYHVLPAQKDKGSWWSRIFKAKTDRT